MKFSKNVIFFFMYMGNLFHITQPVVYSDSTWNTDSEKRLLSVLPAKVKHHDDRSSSAEGSGQQAPITKDLDLLLPNWHLTKSTIKEVQGTMKAHKDESIKNPVQILVVTSEINQNQPGPPGTCLFGESQCFMPTEINGTSLVWDDMRRTLAFVWEFHVYGSVSLFLLLVLLGLLGMFYIHLLPSPLCEVLTLTNSLVVLCGSLRAVLLVLDPYGTCHILSRASFAALHNISLHLLLWAQTSLVLLTLRGITLIFFQLDVQHWWVVGFLSLVHCLSLVIVDLYLNRFYAIPFFLQTCSLCWEIVLSLGIVVKSLSILPQFLPQWILSRRVEMCAKRVTAACAVLGILCSILNLYSLLWVYGLLGNWKRFGWAWWLCQFWGRILELLWGFFLIVLGFWICNSLSSCQSKCKYNPEKHGNILIRTFSYFRKGPLCKSEKTWEELMPNNWSQYRLSRVRMSSALGTHDDQSYKSDLTDPVSTTSCDSQAAVLRHKCSQQDCILSLIEFDMRPPSPINLRHSIDNALMSGSLFIAPPPTWTLPPAYSSFDWTMETDSITASLDHFQTCDSPWVSCDIRPTLITEDDLNS